jgi:hypothetical protein
MLPDLNEKDVHLDSLAQRASEDPAFLARLVQGLSDRQERVGYNCLRALLLLAEENPLLLYSYWEVFVELLRSQNTYFKLRGANLIAAVVSVDRENRSSPPATSPGTREESPGPNRTCRPGSPPDC